MPMIEPDVIDRAMERQSEALKVFGDFIRREFGFDNEVVICQVGEDWFDRGLKISVGGYHIRINDSILYGMVEGIDRVRFIVDELRRFRIHPCARESVLSPEVIGDVE